MGSFIKATVGALLPLSVGFNRYLAVFYLDTEL